MKLLIQGSSVFDGESFKKADVLVENGVITDVSTNIICENAEVINGEGCVLSVGFCDLHVHLRQPGYEHKETIKTGTAAAAAGGFTTICSMPNLRPVPDSKQNLQKQLSVIETDAIVQVLPYGALTKGEKGENLADIEDMASLVAGFTDDGFGVQDDMMMEKAMHKTAKTGKFVAAHCEVEDLLPKNGTCVHDTADFAKRFSYTGHSSESEWKEVERDIDLVRKTGCRLHICHASTKETFELVKKAKEEGLSVTCEVTPHNLSISCDDITEDSGRFKMNPPLRTKEDVKAAQKALRDGVIDAIATDHAPHTDEEKSGGFAKSANGVVGLETAFAACYTHLVEKEVISIDTLLQLLTCRPRQILGTEKKIEKGALADLVLIDLKKEKKVLPSEFSTKGRSTPFENDILRAWPVLTMYNGEIVYKLNEITK